MPSPSGRRHLSILFAGLLLPALVVLAELRPAGAQFPGDPEETTRRLGQLENDVANLNRMIARGGGRSGGNGEALAPTQAVDFEIRLTRLERAVQEMTGKYEEAVFGVTQMRERLDKLANDVDYRLSTLESGGTGVAAIAPAKPGPQPGKSPQSGGLPPTKPHDPPPAAVDPTPHSPSSPPAGTAMTAGGANVQEQYDEAFGLLRRADYDRAERALAAFVAQHKDSPLAGNAQYWLAETFYVRGKYAEAAVAFAEGYKKYPKNPKAPDNLLKLGMSLASLNQKDDACKTFAQLASQFGATAASLKRRADQERKRLNCPGG